MLLKQKPHLKSNGGSTLVEFGVKISIFLLNFFFGKPVSSDGSYFVRDVTFILVCISLIFLISVSVTYSELKILIVVIACLLSVWFLKISSDYLPIWVDNPEIITLWQKDNRFLMTMHLENASQESTLQENPPPEPLPQIASKETQDLLLQELNLYTDNPTQKQEEILRLFNKKLEVLTLPLKGKTTAKRYTILPKEERYSYPSLDEIYWLNKKGLRLLKKYPSLLFKYLRLPLDMDNQHFQVFEITLKEGEKTIVFNGEVEHGDKHWQESEYAAIIDYHHEMPLSVVLDKSKWSSPKLIEEFYVGI